METVDEDSVFKKGFCIHTYIHTAISIKVVPEQSGKVEYQRERLLGIANKFINFLAIPSSLSRSYSTFPLCSGTTLVEIAVYIIAEFRQPQMLG